MIKLLHISDSHGLNEAAGECYDIAMSEDFDACIHTGDVAQDVFEDPIPQEFPYTFLTTIGNHDDILRAGADPSGYHWDVQPTAQELYDKFIAKIENPIVKKNDGHSYYHAVIRDDLYLICVNSCVVEGDPEYDDQIAWLEELLGNCIEDDIKVIIACHFIQPMQYDNLVDCNFSNDYLFGTKRATSYPFDLNQITEDYTFVRNGYEVIANAVDNGLKILFWIHGHCHADGIFIDDKNNLHILITTANYVNLNEDLARTSTAYTARFAANQYDIDDAYNSLTIYRLGADSASDGDFRKMLVIDLNTKEILNSNSIGN